MSNSVAVAPYIQVIPAFEEALTGMAVGGIRRFYISTNVVNSAFCCLCFNDYCIFACLNKSVEIRISFWFKNFVNAHFGF